MPVNTQNKSEELNNLYLLARRFKNSDNAENALKYYDMILLKDPNSWEASFYVVYFRAIQCKIAQIESAANSVCNCIPNVLRLIKNNISNPDEQFKAYAELAESVKTISSLLLIAAFKHYYGIDSQIQSQYKSEYFRRASASIQCVFDFGDYLEKIFENEDKAKSIFLSAWEYGVTECIKIIENSYSPFISTANLYVQKIKSYNPSYISPVDKKVNSLKKSEKRGCIIAVIIFIAFIAIFIKYIADYGYFRYLI